MELTNNTGSQNSFVIRPNSDAISGFTVEMDSEASIDNLKLVCSHKTGLIPAEFKLIHKGKILKCNQHIS